jgi:diguanylate cyclase (GGDEF)-like protein
LALTNPHGCVDEVVVSASAVVDGVDREVRGRTPVQRAAAEMFLLGAAVAGLGIWTTEQAASSRGVQAVISGALLIAGLRMAVPRPVRPSTVELVAIGAIPAVGVLVAVSEPLSAAPFFLLWPVVLIAYFFGRAQLVRAGVLAVVTLGVSLALHSPSPIKVDMFMATAISIGVLGWLIFTMTERQRTLRARLAEAADTDPLTGVLNRRAFHPRLEAALARSAADVPLTVVMFDLDHFKDINDTHGHLVGDAVLERFGEVLRDASRALDLVARFGGEEFVVALPGATSAEALHYTQRVAAMVRSVPGVQVPVAMSAGICQWGPASDSADLILRHADVALYAAKQGGRGRPATWHGQVMVGAPFEDLATAAD